MITVGYDPVEYWPPDWNANTKRKIIHIDVLTAALENCYQPYVELTGDIAQTLDALTPQINRSAKSALSASMLEAIVAERNRLTEESARRGGTPVHPLRLVHELKQFLSSDVTLCLDMGSFHLWIARHLYSFRPRQVLISNGQQTLGVALPWGIAATLVRPSEKILSISGDGGFLYSAMELATAVQEKLPVVVVVVNDGSLTLIKAIQHRRYADRFIAVDLHNPDFALLARAFGVRAWIADSEATLGTALPEALSLGEPALVELRVSGK